MRWLKCIYNSCFGGYGLDKLESKVEVFYEELPFFLELETHLRPAPEGRKREAGRQWVSFSYTWDWT